MPVPEFLPDLLPFNGNWGELEEAAYVQFRQAFIDGRTRYRGTLVTVDKRIDADGKENGFWHIVERKDRNTGERYPVIDQARRLPWILAIINSPDDDSITCFRYLEGNSRIRVYLWVEQAEFVVILEEQKNRVVLITAFLIDSDWKRNDLRKKFRKREA